MVNDKFKFLKIKNYQILFFAALFLLTLIAWAALARFESGGAAKVEQMAVEENKDRQVQIEITPNATYGILMAGAEVDLLIAQEIFAAAQPVYDLSKIRAGKKINLIYEGESDLLKKLVYQIDTETELSVTLKETGQQVAVTGDQALEPVWRAEIQPINYQVRIKTAGGTVESSMYEAALKNSIDERAIIDLADAFQWNIDFAMDPKVGDTFKFIFEERYLNGEYIMPGRILAGQYVNAGAKNQVYYFEESADNKGFFDENGNSAQKMFLKSAIQYKYITSGFTTGLRCLSAKNLCTYHRAIDYAAPSGTPIRSVGDGTVVSAGWSSAGYGNFTKIRHNATYQTHYAHQSRIIVKNGQKVKQGEIIGYVGSTGLSTGPHLHFEMQKNGVLVNPVNEILPPGEPIKEENKPRFFEAIAEYQTQLLNK